MLGECSMEFTVDQEDARTGRANDRNFRRDQIRDQLRRKFIEIVSKQNPRRCRGARVQWYIISRIQRPFFLQGPIEE